MPNPTESYPSTQAALQALEAFLDDTSRLLQTLIDLERRDVLAPEHMLRATDSAIAGLDAWRDTIKSLREQRDT